jgi:hypothetical protein
MALSTHRAGAAAGRASARSLRQGGPFRPFSGRAPTARRAAEEDAAPAAAEAEAAPAAVVEESFSFNLNE